MSQNVYSVTNTYFPTDPPAWDDVQWNVSFNADWDAARVSGRFVLGG